MPLLPLCAFVSCSSVNFTFAYVKVLGIHLLSSVGIYNLGAPRLPPSCCVLHQDLSPFFTDRAT